MNHDLIESLKAHRIALSENLLGRRVTIGLGTLGGSSRRGSSYTPSQTTTTPKKAETPHRPFAGWGESAEESEQIKAAIASGEITPDEVGEWLYQKHKREGKFATK